MMDIHEDSIPFRFTPDGLDEAAIDALINESFAQAADESFDLLMDTPDVRPVRPRAGNGSPNGQAA